MTSRLARLDTGSSTLAVFASHTVVMANGIAGTPARTAVASMTGVSSTAVVSSFRKIVVGAAKTTHSTNTATLLRRARMVTRLATTSKSPPWRPARSPCPGNTDNGQIRSPVARASDQGS
jgi:hypothetical protein